MTYLAAISLLCLLFVQYALFNKQNNPSFIFSAYWFGWFIVAIYFHSEFPVYSAGMWFAAMLCGITFIGFFSGNLVALSTPFTSQMISNSKISIFIKISALAGALSVINLWISAILNGVSFGSISEFFNLATYYSIQRYGDSSYSEPIFTRILNIPLFSGYVLGGILYIKRECKHDAIISLLPLAFALLLTLTLGTRASLLLAGALYAGGILCALDYQGRSKIKIYNPKMWIFFAFIVIGAAFLFVTIQFFRGGNEISDLDTNTVEDTFEHVKTSWLAPFPIFTDLFEKYLAGEDHIALGGYSFFGPLSLLGVESHRNPLPIYYGNGVAGDTNVFSMFGFMLLDWGVVGMSLLFSIFGIVAGFAWRRVRQGSAIWLPMLAGTYSVALWSIVHNIFSQITLVAAFVILACVSFWAFPASYSGSR